MTRLFIALLTLTLLAMPVMAQTLPPLQEDDMLVQLVPLGEDGRPKIWRSAHYPDHYWAHMEARGDTADSVRAFFEQCRQEYGADIAFWPLEAKAVVGLWAISDQATEDNGYEMSGLPGPDDMAPEQVLKLAHEAFLKAAQGVYTQEDLDSARPTIAYLYNQHFPKGRVWMVEYTDARREGGKLAYIELDPEDGSILRIEASPSNG